MDAGAGRRGATLTRRAFLARAAALGVIAAAPGPALAACGTPAPSGGSPPATTSPGRTASPVVTPIPSFRGAAPVVDPTPTKATYGPMLAASAIVPRATLSPALAALLAEVAADAGIAVDPAPVDGRRQAGLSVIDDDSSFGPQGYRLQIAPTDEGAAVIVRAGDEAGAFYGLLSLARLAVVDGPTLWLRAATVEDGPGFARRGAILDPYVLPDTGVTDASRALLLERVRLGVRYKLNLVDLPDRTPWPELVDYCTRHHVELIAAKGYRDWLTTAPRDEVKAALGAQLDAGARSISLNWDDMSLADPVAQARDHAATLTELYGWMRLRDPGIRVSAVFPPYGGVPGRNLSDAGRRYLAAMPGAFPSDVRVFWTGDGGVFSPTVTADGARAYATTVGHEVGLWDNDTITSSRRRKPCSGRAPDLASVAHTYMGNFAGEANWTGTNGEFALLTSLFYAWNPGGYDPAAAAASAERILAS